MRAGRNAGAVRCQIGAIIFMKEALRPQALPLRDDGYCFVCGVNNPVGLHLTFGWDEETGDYVTTYTPAREHQGWAGRTHGGFLAMVFDEVLSRVVLEKRGWNWVTAELTTRLMRPVRIGETLSFRSRITLERTRLTLAVGEAYAGDGTMVAAGQSKMMPVPRAEKE